MLRTIASLLLPLAMSAALAASGAAAEDVEVARLDAEKARRMGRVYGPPPPPALDVALSALPPGVRATPPALPEGWTVEYTTDPDLEARIREILAEGRIGRGQVIVMDPSRGDLLAYVTTDPEAFPSTRTYPTASLMKVVTAAAVLRRAPHAAERLCRYFGSPYVVEEEQLADPKGAREEEIVVATFEDALAISNNQCFARLAVRDVGREALVEEMERAGLLTSPGARHAAGYLEAVSEPLELGRLGSGLAGSYVSPLAAVRLAAALANGDRVAPHWIARVRDADGAIVAAPRPGARRRIWPEPVADALRRALRSVTERGTARRAFRDEDGDPRLGDVVVSGKTGTLRGEDPVGLYQWFVGVAPADAPRVAVAALVAHDPLAMEELTSASDVAAATLEALFCHDAGCDGARLDALHERALARDAEIERELVAQREAERQARIAAQKVEPARLLDAPEIEFPRRLLRRKARGEIVLQVSLAPSGDVADVVVLDESDLPPRFGNFVSEKVREWKFAPTTRGGQPIASELQLRVPVHIR